MALSVSSHPIRYSVGVHRHRSTAVIRPASSSLSEVSTSESSEPSTVTAPSVKSGRSIAALADYLSAKGGVTHKARRKLGQHWLDDQNVVRDVVKAGLVSEGDVVLEVGPGMTSFYCFHNPLSTLMVSFYPQEPAC